jgi:hypothetical protein
LGDRYGLHPIQGCTQFHSLETRITMRLSRNRPR